MFLLLLIAITLSTFLVVHAVLSMVAIAIWRLAQHRIQRRSSRNAAQFLFWLRIFPVIATTFAAAFLVVPAFLRYEPRATGEPVPVPLAILACVNISILAAGLLRSSSALLQSRRIMKSWIANSRIMMMKTHPASIEGISVYRSQLNFPVIAVLGLWPTRILVSESVFCALSTEELDAALRHEAVHAREGDILKKMLLQLSPTVLPMLDILKPISAGWTKMCELAADEDAICEEPSRSVHLASALVKVARLSNASAEMPTLSAALVNEADLFLGRRVQRLLLLSQREVTNSLPLRAMQIRHKLFITSGVLLLCALAYPHALSITHDLLEAFVRIW